MVIHVSARAVQYHLKFAYHDTIVRVPRYTLGTDTSHIFKVSNKLNTIITAL